MNTNDLFKAVMALDLEPIKVKLMHVESGEGWSHAKADLIEKEYRRFLCLMKLYPEEDTAPLVDVDTFWHYHILDTMKYAEDCEQAFGYFLHHYPYVGLRGDGDEAFRVDSGERMRTLYETTFGEAYPIPDLPAQDMQRATAYCAGPWDRKGERNGNSIQLGTAYCAGPWDRKPARKDDAIKAATAYCAGPWDRKPARKDDAIKAATAYCAGPWDRKPARKDDAIGLATAYCAGPWKQAAGQPALAA